jgi:hypothetical protein
MRSEATMCGLPDRRNDYIRPLERPPPSPKISSQWSRVIVLGNRAPFRHERATGGRVVVRRSASGLVPP